MRDNDSQPYGINIDGIVKSKKEQKQKKILEEY